MKHFNTNRKGYIRVLILAALILPIIPFLLTKGGASTNSILIVITLLPLAMLLWVYYGTHYIVKDRILFYRSAFLRGQVDIDKIKEINKGNTYWSGLKPATATKGLLIKYNAYDEIYISPESNDFINPDTSGT